MSDRIKSQERKRMLTAFLKDGGKAKDQEKKHTPKLSIETLICRPESSTSDLKSAIFCSSTKIMRYQVYYIHMVLVA